MARGNGKTPTAEAESGAATVRLLGMEADEFEALTTEHEVSMLQERIAELEFMAEDSGWERIDGGSNDLDLAKDHLRRVIRDAQTMYLANPLINHAVDVIAVYVFGQGVSVSGVGIANDRVQEFMTDRTNLRAFTSNAALLANDRALTYEGNRFYALFGRTGEVTRVRAMPTYEMVAGDVVRNPDDDADVWFYQRRWTRHALEEKGWVNEVRVDYYPDLYYEPKTKPKRLGVGADEGEVHWDSPVIHVKDGGLTGAKYGVPTVFASLAWARAVSRDLSDYATVKRALARFAWKFVSKTRAGARSARDRMATTVTTENPRETNPPPAAGSFATMTEGNDLQPIKTAGAQPNPEEGRRLGLMVAAGVGVPETILFGNADAGNLATAKTLDRPTELMMSARQTMWGDALSDMVAYDLRRAISDGSLPAQEVDPTLPAAQPIFDMATGTAVVDPASMRDVETTPDVSFTDILEDDVTARVGAIVQAATLGASGSRANTMPDDLLSRLLMSALGVEDIDEVIARMFPEGEASPAEAPDVALDAPPAEVAFREALDSFTETLVSGGVGSPRRTRARARSGRGRALTEA